MFLDQCEKYDALWREQAAQNTNVKQKLLLLEQHFQRIVKKLEGVEAAVHEHEIMIKK